MPARLRDLGLWLLVCLPPVAAAVVSPDGPAVVAAVAAVPLLAVAVLLRRRRPLAALAVPVALGLASSAELSAPACWPALALFGYLAGCRMPAARPAVWFFGVVAAAGLPLCVLVERDLWGWPTHLLTVLCGVVLPWQLGRYRRQYAALARTGWRLADRLEREQSAVAERSRYRERARIAGDMHDSLGHDLTLIAVRAGALEVDPALDARHQAAMGELREAAAAATERLRDVIGVLRADGEQPPPPEQGVGDLVDRARASGVRVTLDDRGDLDGLPPMVVLAVGRVVQEGLTNAAKHAPGARVLVRLERAGAAGNLSLTVANGPATAAAPFPPGVFGGSGLVGLDERVRLAGGTLRAGPTADGGFAVTADLPAAAGAGPRPATTAPTRTAAELDLVRREIRRQGKRTVVVPVAVLAGILLLMVPVSLLSSSFSVLERSRYEALSVGETRDEVESRLPLFTRDAPPDDAPAEPPGQDCVYYSTGLLSGDAYRLCFAHGLLASKAVVGRS
ncbi:sensor histidine kinase [Streptomyces sp. NPDC018031]|uniref:sensor histidine kinase n=1 Tax=Streptomyces sp. NPDC018031 TaxID=3365033 RepID=UPI0037A14A20